MGKICALMWCAWMGYTCYLKGKICPVHIWGYRHIFFKFYIVCVCAHVCMHTRLWKSGNNLQESALSLHFVGSRDWAPVLGLGVICLYLFSHLRRPLELQTPNRNIGFTPIFLFSDAKINSVWNNIKIISFPSQRSFQNSSQASPSGQ